MPKSDSEIRSMARDTERRYRHCGGVEGVDHEAGRVVTHEAYGYVISQAVHCRHCYLVIEWRMRPVEDVEAPDLL